MIAEFIAVISWVTLVSDMTFVTALELDWSCDLSQHHVYPEAVITANMLHSHTQECQNEPWNQKK